MRRHLHPNGNDHRSEQHGLRVHANLAWPTTPMAAVMRLIEVSITYTWTQDTEAPVISTTANSGDR
ncbi:MAG: hypothetical protein H6574_17175 [Lewinellaceae bacterium]|nr:hypothetical protein [Lewinellaceae bacterium]